MNQSPLPRIYWKSSPTARYWVDVLWSIGLLLAAMFLYSINLGGVPLRDWDEGIVAQVARDIWRSQQGVSAAVPNGSLTWLFPTLDGDPYVNKPPLVHWLIALAYGMGGVNEWTSRMPGAMLTAFSVPLLYAIGRELFPQRTPAIFSALVYLTFLPVVRHGRLAMLDGAVICSFLLMLFCLLRSRRDLRWGLGIGVGLGMLALTKGVVALLLSAIAFGFIWLDTPRLLTSGYIWMGVLVGSLPAWLWYGAQGVHYGQLFLSTNLMEQSLNRVWQTVESNHGPPWYYLLEILKYGFPWILFLPAGLRLAWENRNLGWAKLVLIWTGVYLAAISLMSTKLPWYVLPVYPALALIVGAELATLWHPGDVFGVQSGRKSPYPKFWLVGLGLTAIAGWAATFYFSGMGPEPKPDLAIILLATTLTLTLAVGLAIRQDSQFLLLLFWGLYVSLLLLMGSANWLWELNESFAVPPVAEMIQQNVPTGRKVLTSYPYHRPSLIFYSDRKVTPDNLDDLAEYWQESDQPYLLVDSNALKSLKLPSVRLLGQSGKWILVTRR